MGHLLLSWLANRDQNQYEETNDAYNSELLHFAHQQLFARRAGQVSSANGLPNRTTKACFCTTLRGQLIPRSRPRQSHREVLVAASSNKALHLTVAVGARR
jgi:hypothetical protein